MNSYRRSSLCKEQRAVTENLVTKPSLLEGGSLLDLCSALAWVFSFSASRLSYWPKVMAVKSQRQTFCLYSYLLRKDPVLDGTGELLEINLESLDVVT